MPHFHKILLISVLAAMASLPLQAQKHFKFTEKCSLAYQQIISLKLQPAAQLLTAEKLADPNNLVPYFLENYIDFFTLFFNEDKREYDLRKPKKAVRLQLMKEGPAQSPFTLFTQSIIYLQWAAVEMKFNNKWAGGWDFRDAFKTANSNGQKFPAFSPNGMITGPMQMVAATVPKNMRWLTNIMGINGTMHEGKMLLDKFMMADDAWGRLFKNEGIFYQCYLQFYLLNQPDDALDFIQQHQLDLVNNHLFAFMAANLHLNSRKSQVTQQIVKNRNLSTEYLQTGIWDFEMAHAKLFHLDHDAPIYFQRFLKSFTGSFYLKDTWLKLGYAYLLAGNTARYKECLQNVISKGSTVTDADKRALKEAKMPRELNLMLLKARLLTDGGYPLDALKVLEGKSSRDFADPAEQLEFMYRIGRIYDDLKQPDRAIAAYDATIQTGRHRSEYFAARAALQAGIIMENKGDKPKAIRYYNTCLSMEGHDFEESIEQKAKAGIARCQ